MKKYYQGLVVDLPECKGTGVILGAHRLNKDTYVGSILGSDGRSYWAKFKVNEPTVGTPIEYIDYYSFDVETVVNFIK